MAVRQRDVSVAPVAGRFFAFRGSVDFGIGGVEVDEHENNYVLSATVPTSEG